ncbi:MAG: 50S ribosomal protein L11 methyltransferase [Deltaproteobacteria bacterium]|nr:50S ribosomal protein L11 methyltransferase [Deltaproteobacteria bacterium]
MLERAAAEAYEAGAAGAIEHEGALELFVPRAHIAGVEHALARLARAGLAVGEPQAERVVEWSQEWKRGLAAVVISPRLLVRPPFADAPADFAGIQLVIEPGQAFGTGGHATTRLALAGLDALPSERVRGARVLDVGCGSGVLALAALALGAAHADGCDLDPLATEAAAVAARENGFAERARWLTGSTAALADRYDGIVANLIRSELAPLLADFARLAKPGAWLVLAGLLASERDVMRAALAAVGFRVLAERSETDATGDAWLGFTAERSA